MISVKPPLPAAATGFFTAIRDKPHWLLAGLLGIHLGLYFWAGPLFYGSDDLAYTLIADSIANGTYQPNPHLHYNRFGATIVPALIFRMFGVNLYTTSLWPLVCSLLLVAAVFLVGSRIFGRLAGFLAALLLATNPLHLTYSLHLMTDGPLSLFSFTSAAALYFGRETRNPRHQLSLAILFAFLFTFAFISKCSALWAGPFLVGLLLFDLVHRQNGRLWFTISITGTILAIVYFGTYYIYTGNFFYRFTGVNELLDPKNHLSIRQLQDYYVNKPLSAYITRLTYEPVRMFLASPAVILPMLLALPALVRPFKAIAPLPDSVRFWAFFSWSVILSLWFGSYSTRYYSPFGLYDYYLLPITPVLCLLAGVTLASLVESPAADGRRLLWAMALLFVAMVPVQRFLLNEKLGILLTGIPLVTLALARSWLPELPWKRTLLPVAFVALVVVTDLLIPSVGIHRGELGETALQRDERELVQKHLANPSGPTLVLTDSRSAKVISFYLGLRTPTSLRLLSWGEAEAAVVAENRRLLYFVHAGRLKSSRGTYGYAIPAFVTHPPPDWRLLESRQGISLFEARSVTPPPL
ncbi:MAG: glycosyltransferase family 39 protein [Magnetococcales bacterium]|nr:glycosyltransferase family 39 protein [Magnetococcales bacterium]